MKSTVYVCHVGIGSLPIGAEFLHKDKAYKKTDEGHAIDFRGREWFMPPHYGAIITPIQFTNYNLTNEDLYDAD